MLVEVVDKEGIVVDGSSSGCRGGVGVVDAVVRLLSVGPKLDWGATVRGGDCNCVALPLPTAETSDGATRLKEPVTV